MDKKEYAAFEKALAANGMANLSSGKVDDCPECPEGEDEGHFSWSACDSCNRPLGGDRYAAHFTDSSSAAGEVYHADICADCVYSAAYGRLDDATMEEIAES